MRRCSGMTFPVRRYSVGSVATKYLFRGWWPLTISAASCRPVSCPHHRCNFGVGRPDEAYETTAVLTVSSSTTRYVHRVCEFQVVRASSVTESVPSPDASPARRFSTGRFELSITFSGDSSSRVLTGNLPHFGTCRTKALTVVRGRSQPQM